MERDGDLVRLPASVGLAAYRIIQEALTDSARHSGGTRATVRICCRQDQVQIEVDDNGTGKPSARPTGTGNGIAGTTERARALGGSLAAGPRPGVHGMTTAALAGVGVLVARAACLFFLPGRRAREESPAAQPTCEDQRAQADA